MEALLALGFPGRLLWSGPVLPFEVASTSAVHPWAASSPAGQPWVAVASSPAGHPWVAAASSSSRDDLRLADTSLVGVQVAEPLLEPVQVAAPYLGMLMERSS